MKLTAREKEIVELIIKEYSSVEISKKLKISVRTVDTHRKNISKKLKTKSLIGLTKYAIKEGMLKNFLWTPH